MSVQALFFDKNGNLISGTSQTTVNGVAGIFYMSLKVQGTNTGNVPLTGITVSGVSPNDFVLALQGQTPLRSSLAVGENKILLLDTANSCITDAQCASNEKCVNTFCRIDISNLVGTIHFTSTINANYTNAYGTVSQVSALVDLPITFAQDEVVFRTTAVNGDYAVAGVQIAVDSNADGNLEAWTYWTGGSEQYNPSTFLAYTPQNNLVWKCDSGTRVCISASTTLNKDVYQASVTKRIFNEGGNIPTSKSPTQPYSSQNCGGSMPCQERYSVAVAPPQQTCGNNLKEGTEVCDGVDLAGNNCTTIGQGFNGGTLTCGAGCNSWVTSACTAPAGGSVKVRVSDLGYGSTSAVGFTSSCGSALTQYGYTATSGQLSGNCSASTMMGQCDMSAISITLLVSNLPDGWRSGAEQPSLWKPTCSPDCPTKICVCDSGSDGKYTVKRYSSTDSDAVNVDPSSSPISPSYEIAC